MDSDEGASSEQGMVERQRHRPFMAMANGGLLHDEDGAGDAGEALMRDARYVEVRTSSGSTSLEYSSSTLYENSARLGGTHLQKRAVCNGWTLTLTTCVQASLSFRFSCSSAFPPVKFPSTLGSTMRRLISVHL